MLEEKVKDAWKAKLKQNEIEYERSISDGVVTTGLPRQVVVRAERTISLRSGIEGSDSANAVHTFGESVFQARALGLNHALIQHARLIFCFRCEVFTEVAYQPYKRRCDECGANFQPFR